MSGQTPGPWTMSRSGAMFYVEATDHKGIWLVAEVNGRTLAENEANTRAIAAVPEMLESLRAQALRHWPECNVHQNDHCTCGTDVARALLARIDLSWPNWSGRRREDK